MNLLQQNKKPFVPLHNTKLLFIQLISYATKHCRCCQVEKLWKRQTKSLSNCFALSHLIIIVSENFSLQQELVLSILFTTNSLIFKEIKWFRDLKFNWSGSFEKKKLNFSQQFGDYVKHKTLVFFPHKSSTHFLSRCSHYLLVYCLMLLLSILFCLFSLQNVAAHENGFY